MKDSSKKGKQISRRVMLPLLGGTLLIPLLGFSDKDSEESPLLKDEAYETLLKKDGTTVRVKVSTIKKSNVVKKNVSNKSFFNWLRK